MTKLQNSDVYGLGKVLRNKVEIWKNIDFDLGEALNELVPLNDSKFSFAASDEEAEVNLPIALDFIDEWGRLSIDAEPTSNLGVVIVPKVMCSVIPEDDGTYPPYEAVKEDIMQLSSVMNATAAKVEKDIEKVLGKGTVACKSWVDMDDVTPMFGMTIIITVPVIPTSTSNVRTWMQIVHAQDELVDKMNPRLTFAQAYTGLKAGKDVYKMLGVADSVLRENLFSGLALAYNVDYDVFYNMWRDNAE